MQIAHQKTKRSDSEDGAAQDQGLPRSAFPKRLWLFDDLARHHLPIRRRHVLEKVREKAFESWRKAVAEEWAAVGVTFVAATLDHVGEEARSSEAGRLLRSAALGSAPTTPTHVQTRNRSERGDQVMEKVLTRFVTDGLSW